MEKYFESIISFLKSSTDRELPEITGDSHLIGDLGFNSLELVQMVNEAEDVFGIVVEDKELGQIVTVNDFASLLMKKNAKI